MIPLNCADAGSKSPYQRFKALQKVLIDFISKARLINDDTSLFPYEEHLALQDAWADIADLTPAAMTYRYHHIEETVFSEWPDDHYKTWKFALYQAAELKIHEGYEGA